MTLIFLSVWRGKQRVIVAANAQIPRGSYQADPRKEKRL
jgi:hypothetical protein